MSESVTAPVSIGAQAASPVSSANGQRDGRATAPRLRVRLSAREQAVVEAVAQLGQLTARQIGDLAFAGLKSPTPLKRTLKRLTDRGVLARLQLRIVGGSGGGSTTFVYQIGRVGGRLLGLPRDYPRYSAVDDHMLDTAECLVRLKGLERSGVLTVLDYLGEDAAYREVGGIKLTPDLYVRVQLHASGRQLFRYLEVDRATERLPQIAEKCGRYFQAYKLWDSEVHGAVFPRVLFVVPDERRQREIARVIAKQPKEARPIFQVCVMADFPACLLTEVGYPQE